MSETPKNSGNKHPEKDRRLHARQRIHSLSYAKIGDGNGGIVLNISESGISVQAAGVLDESEPVTMWLEIPHVKDRVEVAAEIVWLSATRKEAGLRFVNLPASTLRQIQKWMAREAAPEKFEDETGLVDEEQERPVEVAQTDDVKVRELEEANIMSSDEIRSLESKPESIEGFPTAELPEQQEEVTVQAPIEANQHDDAEEDANTENEAEPETETETETESEVVKQGEADPEGDIAAEEQTEAEEEAKEDDDESSIEEPVTEDELIKAFGPPVVPFERRPHTPFSSMSAISGGSWGAQNLATAPAIAQVIPQPLEEHVVAQPEASAGSDFKDFRIQLQTGWFLAALVLLLALISFIAGMAVRRGALNGVMGEQEDSLVPKGAPAANVTSASTNATAGASGNAAPANPLTIEIVDTANRRWVISASTIANRPGVAGAAGKESNRSTDTAASSEANHPVPQNIGSQTQSSTQTAATAGGQGGPHAEKSTVPLVLSLPETPISASGSVAISSQRSVPMPLDGTQSGKNGRNLQVGQLVNLVEPVYPADAVQQKIEGTVKLHAVVGTDGVIESLAQVSGPQILVNASMAAVRNWKYSPTRMNGQAIETQEDISFVFRLPN